MLMERGNSCYSCGGLVMPLPSIYRLRYSPNQNITVTSMGAITVGMDEAVVQNPGGTDEIFCLLQTGKQNGKL